MRDRRLLLLVAFGLGAACAAPEVDPSADQERARTLIRESTGQDEILDPDAPPLSNPVIEAALADGLGLEEALRLALLNSRRLRAGFSSLGVARADFVQAGLLRNPSLGIGFLFPSGGGRPKITADLVQSLVDLWDLPARQDVAGRALEQRVLEVSRFAGELVVDTKDAYFASVAARDLLTNARENVDVAAASLAAVRRRVEGGVATAIEESLAHSQALGARLVAQNAERESFGTRRRLAALLSLDGDLRQVELVDPLPEPSSSGPDGESLAARSRTMRLDLRAAAAEVAAAEAEVALERRRAVPEIDVGVSLERPESGASTNLLVGPGASVELPIFDRHHARMRRAEFRRDQLRHEYEALVAEVGQEVRAAVDRAASSADSARFVTDELLPQAERGLALTRASYELGDTTLLALLESQRAALMARGTRIEAQLEATRTRVDIERVLGASLSVLGVSADE